VNVFDKKLTSAYLRSDNQDDVCSAPAFKALSSRFSKALGDATGIVSELRGNVTRASPAALSGSEGGGGRPRCLRPTDALHPPWFGPPSTPRNRDFNFNSILHVLTRPREARWRSSNRTILATPGYVFVIPGVPNISQHGRALSRQQTGTARRDRRHRVQGSACATSCIPSRRRAYLVPGRRK